MPNDNLPFIEPFRNNMVTLALPGGDTLSLFKHSPPLDLAGVVEIVVVSSRLLSLAFHIIGFSVGVACMSMHFLHPHNVRYVNLWCLCIQLLHECIVLSLGFTEHL